jgi:hypothetical protein
MRNYYVSIDYGDGKILGIAGTPEVTLAQTATPPAAN